MGDDRILITNLPNAEEQTHELLISMNEFRSEFTNSHNFRGRWENSYLNIECVPGVREVMRFARELGLKVLNIRSVILLNTQEETQNCNSNFWFNVAKKGEVTGLHDHAANSVLSAVTYLQSEHDSGNIFFRKDGFNDIEVKPEVGRLVLFPSKLKHGVHENKSKKERISLAFNLLHFPLKNEYL